MTDAIPSSTTAAGQDPDLLAEAALKSLTREHPLRPRWGPAKTILFGAATFGLLPIYAWPKAFRTAATIERQQLWHLAEWVRLRSGHPEDGRLSALANRVGFRPILWHCAMLCVAVTVACFAYQASRYGFDFHDLRAATYSFGRMHAPHLPYEVTRQLFATWTVGLCLAYSLHWYHLQLHNAEVRRFVEAFNELTFREQIRPVLPARQTLGLGPIWVIGAIAMVSAGAIWAIPMVMAGALEARWPKESRSIRSGLSESLRQMLLLRRPVLRVPRPAKLGEFCPNDLCRGRVPPQAIFCPRCGLHVSGGVAEINQVA